MGHYPAGMGIFPHRGRGESGLGGEPADEGARLGEIRPDGERAARRPDRVGEHAAPLEVERRAQLGPCGEVRDALGVAVGPRGRIDGDRDIAPEIRRPPPS